MTSIAAKMLGQTGVMQTALSPVPQSTCTISTIAFMPLEVTTIRSSETPIFQCRW